MNIIYISMFLFIWALFGGIFYLFTFNRVSLPTQKFALWILSGPIFWLAVPIFKTLDILAEKIFEPFYNWLTKE